MSAVELVTVSCPKCHVRRHTKPESYGRRDCLNCGAVFTIRSFPADNPSGMVWATAMGDPNGRCGTVVGRDSDGNLICAKSAGHDGPCNALVDDSFATVEGSIKALADQEREKIAAHTPPKFQRTSRLRHWWNTKVGKLRHALREWLGIVSMDEDYGVAWDYLYGLRRDLDAVAKAAQEVGSKLEYRCDATDKNALDAVRQLHAIDGKASDALNRIAVAERLIVAWKGIPLLARAWNDAKGREDKKMRKGMKHLATLGPDAKAIAVGDQIVVASPDAPSRVFPEGEELKPTRPESD